MALGACWPVAQFDVEGERAMNSPYQPDPYQQQPYQGQPHQQQPYPQQPYPQQPYQAVLPVAVTKKRKPWLLPTLIGGGVAVALCCGGVLVTMANSGSTPT